MTWVDPAGFQTNSFAICSGVLEQYPSPLRLNLHVAPLENFEGGSSREASAPQPEGTPLRTRAWTTRACPLSAAAAAHAPRALPTSLSPRVPREQILFGVCSI